MINRETVRDTLTAGLTAKLVTAEGVVDSGNVYSHRIYDPAGESPVVGVFSLGSERERLTLSGGRSALRFGVELWVRAQASGWTAADAEDRIDLLEKHVADYVNDNRQTDDWNLLEYDASGSSLMDLTIGGEVYLIEVILLRAEVYG